MVKVLNHRWLPPLFIISKVFSSVPERSKLLFQPPASPNPCATGIPPKRTEIFELEIEGETFNLVIPSSKVRFTLAFSFFSVSTFKTTSCDDLDSTSVCTTGLSLINMPEIGLFGTISLPA